MVEPFHNFLRKQLTTANLGRVAAGRLWPVWAGGAGSRGEGALWAIHRVYGRLAHKDDPLQISAVRPAPTIIPHELCKTSNYSVYMCYYHMYHLYYSSGSIPSMILLILCMPFSLKCM